MRGVVRPAVAVLLLVGVGMAAADRVAGPRCCGPICALIIADDDELARVGAVPVIVPEPPAIHAAIQAPLDVSTPAPPPPVVALDLLISAPKTSPPV